MNIGAWISVYRELNNVTQETIAQRLGVDKSSVSRWEKNEKEPSIAKIYELADLIGVDVSTMLSPQFNDAEMIYDIMELDLPRKHPSIIGLTSVYDNVHDYDTFCMFLELSQQIRKMLSPGMPLGVLIIGEDTEDCIDEMITFVEKKKDIISFVKYVDNKEFTIAPGLLSNIAVPKDVIPDNVFTVKFKLLRDGEYVNCKWITDLSKLWFSTHEDINKEPDFIFGTWDAQAKELKNVDVRVFRFQIPGEIYLYEKYLQMNQIGVYEQELRSHLEIEDTDEACEYCINCFEFTGEPISIAQAFNSFENKIPKAQGKHNRIWLIIRKNTELMCAEAMVVACKKLNLSDANLTVKEVYDESMSQTKVFLQIISEVSVVSS